MPFVIPGCKPEPPTRVAGKMIHLTYAALYDGELNFDIILQKARTWAATRDGLREYVIGKERHIQPADPQRAEHFHVYIKFGKKVDLPNRLHTTLFDLRGREGRTLHPEVQTVLSSPADRERVIRYDMKEGAYVGEIDPPLTYDPRRDERREEEPPQDDVEDEEESDDGGGSEKPPAWATMLNKVHGVGEGMMLLAEKAPHIYYLNGSRIKGMLTERIGIAEPKLFSLADFNRSALDLSLPVVLYGETECGKTEFAVAHFEHPLVVRRRDDLKRMTFMTDGLIFDDVSFENWSVEDALCLLNMDKPRSLPARFHDAFVQADMPMIFTTNKRPSEIFPRADSSRQRHALKRRYAAVEVTRTLARGGRPFTAAEKRARREAGRNGPQGPGADAAERELFG